MNRILGTLLFTVLVFPFVAAPAHADCDELIVRTWQSGKNHFQPLDEELVLEPGDSGSIYVTVESQSRSPYGTTAEIAAPMVLGLPGPRSQQVQEVIALTKQDAEDVREGKIDFEAKRPGTTKLAYRIKSVSNPGDIDDVSKACRSGHITIRVAGDVPPPAAAPQPDPAPPAAGLSPNEAAHRLISDLYTAILRRDAAGEYPDSFFDMVVEQGHRGLVTIAGEMLISDEFRTQALARTRDRLAAAGVDASGLSQTVVVDQLLKDLYADLYGGADVAATTRESHMQTLSGCLDGSAREVVCRSLGADLVRDRRYVDANRQLLAVWPSRGYR